MACARPGTQQPSATRSVRLLWRQPATGRALTCPTPGVCTAAALPRGHARRRCSRRPGQQLRPRSTTAGSASVAGTLDTELLAAVERLYALRLAEKTTQEELDAALAQVEGLSEAAGVDRVLPQLNDGSFKGYTLSGRLRQDLAAGAVTLGRISFGLYQPADLLVELQSSELALVTKGEWRGRSSAYVVSTYLTVAPQEGEGGKYAGLQGMSYAIGRYEPNPDNPRRLDIQFDALLLEPAPEQRGDLSRWLELFQAHNPAMSAEGVLEVLLPEQAAPKGWLDHLMTLPGWQITQGNFGSKTLLRRVG